MNDQSIEGSGRPLQLVPQPPPEASASLERDARLEFAEALGRRALAGDPTLFERSLVGSWESVEHLVDNFLVESGWQAQVDGLPAEVRPFVTFDRLRVADNLRQNLLVVPVGQGVWVFDAPSVVKTTVRKTEREVHNDG